MPNYEINPVLHNQGGLNTPYEKYHLTEAQWERAIRSATAAQDGLAPAGAMDYMDYVTPPLESNSPGTEGQRALDDNYFYLCVGTDTWRRIPLTSF
jgi:hypothetical protein